MLMQYYLVIYFFTLTKCQIQSSRFEAQVKDLNPFQIRQQKSETNDLGQSYDVWILELFYESKVSLIS